MEFKIAVYGIGRRAEKFMMALKNRTENIDIVYFVQSEKTEMFFFDKEVINASEIDYSDIDYLVIASNVYYKEIINHLKRVDPNYDIHENKILLYSEFLMKLAPKEMPFWSCKVDDDIVYIMSNNDTILRDMLEIKKNWAEDDIKTFFDLTSRFYVNSGQQDSLSGEKYFLDIGANIGTTSIYVKKVINKNLKVIGFEPNKESFDLFRVNCILNNVEEIEKEHLGISNDNGVKYFKPSSTNSGEFKIVEDVTDEKNLIQCNVMRLDDYLEQKRILPSEIGYVWIDVEGHEYEVLAGAVKTLEVCKIPLFQEFNPQTYFSKGVLEKYCELMKHLYDNFIDVDRYLVNDDVVYETSKLYPFALKWIEQGKKLTDLFFF